MTMDAVRWMVLIVWLVLVGALIRSHLGDEAAIAPSDDGSAAPASAPRVVAPEETWMGVYMRERKIGYSHHKITPSPQGYRIEERSLLRTRVLETEQTIQFSATGETDREFRLRAFDVSLRSGVGDLALEGRVGDRALTIEMKVGGEKRSEERALDGPIYLPVGARRNLSAGGLAAGRTARLSIFDPSTMQSQPVEMRVEGRATIDWNGQKREAWRVRESFRGIETVLWVDDAGETLREEGPMGLVTVREDAARAVGEGWVGDGGLDLMAAVAVRVNRPLTAARQQRSLVLKLGGVEAVRPPDDARQSFRDGILRISREDLAGRPSYVLPYAGTEWRDDLGATTFLQSDHRRVRAKSAEILGGETDARRAARLLRTWVFEHLEKVPVASIPNALQVLEMGRGDCNEHAVLLAALARAAGLPARVVAGAVYLDGVFLYHAWNEIWLGDQWVSADAAFDQMPVDATHVKLVTGGPEDHLAMLPIIGRLSIEIVSEDAASYGGQSPSDKSVALERR